MVSRPGPKGVFLLGSLHEFRRDPLGFCTRVAREYGDIVFFRMGPLRCVQINRPEWIQELLTKDAPRTHKSVDFKELESMLGKGLVTSEDELWRRERRLIQPAFHADRIRVYEGTMVERVQAMLESWRDGQELELSAAMSRVTLQIVGQTLFGSDMDDDARVMAESITAFMDRFEQFMTSWLPLPVTWPLPGNRAARRAVRELDRVVHRMVAERRAAGPGDDLLWWLLQARDERGAIDEQQLRDELVTLLLAGHETTSLALSWTLLLLSENREVEARLVEELARVLGGRPPTGEDVPALEYTRQVVEEGLRLRPPVWGIGRKALEDLELDGHGIRKGTQIFFVQWVTHRDPRFFVDPERFDPERWSEERRQAIPACACFPFGAGPRKCIGTHFAMLEAVLLLASIVQRFHVHVLPGSIELQPAVTLRPKTGIQARLEARAQAVRPQPVGSKGGVRPLGRDRADGSSG